MLELRDGNTMIHLIFIHLGICVCTLHGGLDGKVTIVLFCIHDIFFSIKFFYAGTYKIYKF